jgi:hypothetical protein
VGVVEEKVVRDIPSASVLVSAFNVRLTEISIALKINLLVAAREVQLAHCSVISEARMPMP